MIGFILGTSEGKKILSLMNKYNDEIAVSTATTYGGELLKEFNIKNLNTKPLNKEELFNWIKNNKLDILVDASHPYAQEITKNAIECAAELEILYVRYERLSALEHIKGHDVIRVSNYDEAILYIKTLDGNVLNTTGGNNVCKFIDIDFKYRIIHRILPSPKVLSKIVNAGINIKDIIAMQGPISFDLEKAFINQFNIKAILTKDSGIEGGALEKFRASRNCGIKTIVIEKPKFNYNLVFNNIENLVEYLKQFNNRSFQYTKNI